MCHSRLALGIWDLDGHNWRRDTHKELDEKRKKLERVAERMVLRPFRSVLVQRHRERDGQMIG
ncbi:MAG TPA: hypothetical protein VIV60_09590 [Polyangiaceae bacterium]